MNRENHTLRLPAATSSRSSRIRRSAVRSAFSLPSLVSETSPAMPCLLLHPIRPPRWSTTTTTVTTHPPRCLPYPTLCRKPPIARPGRLIAKPNRFPSPKSQAVPLPPPAVQHHRAALSVPSEWRKNLMDNSPSVLVLVEARFSGVLKHR
ncbi:uncharacterized protein CCOS01_06244 [Colletotrichum costaricense]|uniref:Uncharacterized protein n=1 Tax=Colletotrichum costaricense TaxID=1209916 RepID=A0AAI9YY23_9PEZI|nr:uncharacterized protein CCOS01_06244 [Colletotrichum costaricense]KAK1528410.1 hypothetical protein CCOS01_06244 [Colletotrichum costaricense]